MCTCVHMRCLVSWLPWPQFWQVNLEATHRQARSHLHHLCPGRLEISVGLMLGRALAGSHLSSTASLGLQPAPQVPREPLPHHSRPSLVGCEKQSTRSCEPHRLITQYSGGDISTFIYLALNICKLKGFLLLKITVKLTSDVFLLFKEEQYCRTGSDDISHSGCVLLGLSSGSQPSVCGCSGPLVRWGAPCGWKPNHCQERKIHCRLHPQHP